MNTGEIQNSDTRENAALEEERHFGTVKGVNVKMLESESVISPPVAEIPLEHHYEQNPRASHPPVQNARPSLNGKFPLFAFAAIAILLCAGVTAFLFYNRSQTPVSQETAVENTNYSETQKTSEIPATSEPVEVLETTKDSETAVQTSPTENVDFTTPAIVNQPSVITRNDIRGESFDKPQRTVVDGDTVTELNSSLDNWINATNAKDIDQQMTYYAPKLGSFYRARNASKNAVLDEKRRVFSGVDAVDIKTGKPNITVSPDGKTATMRFRKKYSIKKGQQNRNGEVLQEMKWVKSKDGWRIVSERDVKVIN